MPNCYLCGRKIPDGTGVRRQFQTGQSRTVGFFGRRVGSSATERYGLRLICQECDSEQNAAAVSGFIIKVVGVVLLIIIYKCCN